MAVKAALDEQKVPIKYWQWDGKCMQILTEFGLSACVVCIPPPSTSWLLVRLPSFWLIVRRLVVSRPRGLRLLR